MRDQLQRRLAELRSEYENGQRQAAELESRLGALRATLDRINAAIEVIQNQLSQAIDHPAS